MYYELLFTYRHQFDETFKNISDLKPAVMVYLTAKKLLNYCNEQRDRHRFEKLCRYCTNILSPLLTLIKLT